MKLGEQHTVAENDKHWPYRAEDDDSDVADLNDILGVVVQLSKALGPGAATVSTICADIIEGCERFESMADSLAEQKEQTAESQAEAGRSLQQLQRAAGLSLEEFAERYRAEYFQKLSAGELTSFEVRSLRRPALAPLDRHCCCRRRRRRRRRRRGHEI